MHARAVQAQTHARANPYASIAASGCKDPLLACANAATPLLTNDGALWLAWTAGGAVSIARSADDGRTFGPRVEIARHGAYLDTGADARPQVVADGRGNLVVGYAFFRDNHWNAQVNVSTSSDSGATFSAPRSISTDGSSQRFATLVVDPHG